MQADVGPACACSKAGVGSGALSMTLLRAGAIVTGYGSARISPSRRRRTSTTCSVPTSPTMQIRDVRMGIDETDSIASF